MPGRRDSGFTLIELLVVISIIALLISLLLPALGQAREQVIAVQCAAQERQIGMAMFMYTEENEGEYPPGSVPAGEERWAVKLNAYIQDESTFKCPSRIAPGGFMGYRANGSTWMVWADWWDGGGRPVTHTRINQARSPSQLVLMDEDMEDLANPNVRYVAVGIESLGWGPSFDYSRYNGCCEARIHGGRHFTNGAPAGVYWEDIALRSGQTNILFVDGHVSLVDMTGLIESEGTQQAFFSYPWSAGAFYDLVWAPPTQRQEPSAPAGALWWRVPWW